MQLKLLQKEQFKKQQKLIGNKDLIGNKIANKTTKNKHKILHGYSKVKQKYQNKENTKISTGISKINKLVI